MSMTKKHYIAIAAILRDANSIPEVTENLSYYFKQDNPNFMPDTFLAATMYPKPEVVLVIPPIIKKEDLDGNTYKIVRKFMTVSKRDRIIHRGLTLAEAKAHCKDKETSSSTCISTKAMKLTQTHGEWFDAYTKE